MKINTQSECEAAKRAVMSALSAINARERELRWLKESYRNSKYHQITIEAKIKTAQAKRIEALAEFKLLKSLAEWTSSNNPCPSVRHDGTYPGK